MNRLVYLSILSLIGFLGLKGNAGFYGFFGFLYYLRYVTVPYDELFASYIQRACVRAFFTSVLATGLALFAYVINPHFITANIALASNFIVLIVVFTVTMFYFEIKETIGEKDEVED